MTEGELSGLQAFRSYPTQAQRAIADSRGRPDGLLRAEPGAGTLSRTRGRRAGAGPTATPCRGGPETATVSADRRPTATSWPTQARRVTETEGVHAPCSDTVPRTRPYKIRVGSRTPCDPPTVTVGTDNTTGATTTSDPATARRGRGTRVGARRRALGPRRPTLITGRRPLTS